MIGSLLIFSLIYGELIYRLICWHSRCPLHHHAVGGRTHWNYPVVLAWKLVRDFWLTGLINFILISTLRQGQSVNCWLNSRKRDQYLTSHDQHVQEIVFARFCAKKSIRKASLELNYLKSTTRHSEKGTFSSVQAANFASSYQRRSWSSIRNVSVVHRTNSCRQWFLIEGDFSNKANICVNGEMNKQNLRYW